ncbi:MAG: DUF4129 domain-containing protein [Caldimonas sp.]
MPSRADRPVRAWAAVGARSARAVAVAVAVPVALALATTVTLAATAASSTPPLDAARVEQAASAVRADPDLGGTKKEQTWRFRDRSKPERSQPPAPWLFQLARWLAESGRVVVWILAAIAIAVVVVAARRWLAVRGESAAGRGARLPSHVRELDIRPESLPLDIGAAVRELWLAGERRAALSLLYRGALSRLVHSYEVAIGDASTEGDCVRLARAALPPPRSDFVTALVDAWQLAVYGGRPLASEHVLRLCADFDRFLPAVAAAAPGAGAGRR